ncbi:hypothetical protein [Bacillus sp. SA1-12]|nr:hypothetical protein [Bacillus sp. SA1-12]
MGKVERQQNGNNKETLSAKDLAKDPTPEENPKYGSKSHKNS